MNTYSKPYHMYVKPVFGIKVLYNYIYTIVTIIYKYLFYKDANVCVFLLRFY